MSGLYVDVVNKLNCEKVVKEDILNAERSIQYVST